MATITNELDWWTEHIPRPRRVMAPFAYYGGKGPLARRIVRLLPRGKVYVEPYCGAASVFWHLPEPYPVEVLNDIDERVVNVFRALQDPETFDRFCHRAFWTPYSRAEFVRAIGLLDSDDPVDRAWAFFVVANQAVSGRTERLTPGSWGRCFSFSPGRRWAIRKSLLRFWHERLQGVQLDCRDALEVIRYWDSPETVFYIDPPFVEGTLRSKKMYRHEADERHHQQLVDLLLGLQGSAVVSGHDCAIYRPLEEAGWERFEFRTSVHGAVRTRASGLRGPGAALAKVPRTEVVWRRVR